MSTTILSREHMKLLDGFDRSEDDRLRFELAGGVSVHLEDSR
jgi:hypothetical protein